MGVQRACCAAIVSSVSPSWEYMALIRAISSADFPSAIEQAMAVIVIARSQEVMESPRDSICGRVKEKTKISSDFRFFMWYNAVIKRSVTNRVYVCTAM